MSVDCARRWLVAGFRRIRMEDEPIRIHLETAHLPLAFKAASMRGEKIGLPILHLPQMIGLSMGIPPKELGLQRHIVSTKGILAKASVRA